METRIEVNEFIENVDGTSNITVTIDYETLLLFARKGLLATLKESAEDIMQKQALEE